MQELPLILNEFQDSGLAHLAYLMEGVTMTGISQPAAKPCTAVCASSAKAPSAMTTAARFSAASCSAISSWCSQRDAPLLSA